MSIRMRLSIVPGGDMERARRTPLTACCGECGHEWTVAYLPMPVDAFVKFVHSRCPLCASDRLFVQGRLDTAVDNSDVGISSRTISGVMEGYPVAIACVPWDPADFGRCYRLLEKHPEWRGRLQEVADRYPDWQPLVDAWDELTALYEEEAPSGDAPRLYERLKALTRGARYWRGR